MNIDDFKTTLAGCSSELLDAYIDACQEELAIRKLKETEKLKETLKHLDKAQLRILFADLGLALEAVEPTVPAPVAEKKTRTKRSVIPHGYKEYAVGDTTYYVAPFFNPALNKISKGAKASWLEQLSAEERQEQFGTIPLITKEKITLTDLVEADSEAVQIVVGETMQRVTTEMLVDAVSIRTRQ